MAELIGGSLSKSTWGSLRSPMWKGSGYRGMTLPANKNEHNDTNSKYVENLGELSIAFPFINDFTTGTYWASSMCLGLNYVMTQYPDDEADPPVPAILDFYLTHGEGIWTSLGGFEQVINGYSLSSYLIASGRVGYDTLRARDQYRAAVVNITFTPGPTLSPVTTDVTITDDLFPDDLVLPGSGSQGIYIGTYTWPAPSGSLTWTQPYWTINSLTMP